MPAYSGPDHLAGARRPVSALGALLGPVLVSVPITGGVLVVMSAILLGIWYI
jgi:hypothetical protein